jgi:hypothetical protein
LCRDDQESQRLIEEHGFPGVLKFGDMALFLGYPTLCFQLHYPRTKRIRKTRLARHIVALLICCSLSYILVEQYITPLLENARQHVTKEHTDQGTRLRFDFVGLFERLLKLSLPNLYLWLLMFYSIFHCWLNILGELTRFGDRRFYDDWWNAASFAEYWKSWMLPIHHWMLRHVYFPMLRRGFSGIAAGFVIFLVSGLLHEYLVVVPLRINRPTGVVTLAFLGQLPLLAITSNPHLEKRNRTLGNMIFWFIFCFSGQPVAVMLYYILAADKELTTINALLSHR